MMNDVLVYGATGYTGRLIAEHAVERGLNPVVAGRDAGAVRLLADRLRFRHRVFDLGDRSTLLDGLAPYHGCPPRGRPVLGHLSLDGGSLHRGQRAVVVAEAWNAAVQSAVSKLVTPDPYAPHRVDRRRDRAPSGRRRCYRRLQDAVRCVWRRLHHEF